MRSNSLRPHRSKRLGIIQTRLIVACAAVLLAWLTPLFENPALLCWVFVVYLLLTSLLAMWRDVLERKRRRAIPIAFDILAISLLIWSEGGAESPFSLLYLFPVLSAARYLGRPVTFVVAFCALVAYCFASAFSPNTAAFMASLGFWLRVLVLIGVAGTSANLAKLRDRAESRLVRAIEEIDSLILRDVDLRKVMSVINTTAINVTSSDASAMVLADRDDRFGESTNGKDAEEATRLVAKFYRHVAESGRPYSLPERPFNAVLKSIGRSRGVTYRSAELIPIATGDRLLGVLGVFSRWSLHYTNGDRERLRAMSPLVAIAQKNATLYPQLAMSETYFGNLFYNSPDPIIVLDGKGKVQNFNRECEKIWGFDEDDVRGHHVREYYESPEHAREIGVKLQEERTIRDFAARIKDRKGNIIPIRLSATMFFDKENRRIGSIGVFKDDRRLRAEQLAAFGQLAQNTIHDIKTEIAIVQNYVSGLAAMSEDDPAMKTACVGIREATTAALSKLQHILMTAKPRLPQKEVLSLLSFLSDFEAGVAGWISAAGVEFVVSSPRNDVAVLGDADELKQVLTNLLANSIDAIEEARPPRAGRIELRVTTDDHSLDLSWCDNGVGMSPDAMRNAFTPFYTTKSSGTGLGLYNTKTIIDNHDGRISVEAAEGAGTCFDITLPLGDSGAQSSGNSNS